MQKRIILPQVELNMESVAVLEWLVGVGDHIKAGQNLIRVETQKAVVEVPSSDDGFVRKKCVEVGDSIGEKALLSILSDTIDEPIEEISADGALAKNNQSGSSAKAQAPVSVQPSSATTPVAPAARRIAKELNVDLSKVKGTGPGGRITVEDVQKAASGSTAADLQPASNGWSNLSASRIALIDQMQKSLAEIPQFHIVREMDVSPLLKKNEGFTFTHRLVFALARALEQHPALRTRIEANRTKAEPVSVAVAMETSQGLIAPAVRNAEKMTLEEVSSACLQFKEKAIAGTIRREELINAPFAISNLGMLGVDFFSPFVFHGQTAVLAVGRARDASSNRKVAWFNLGVDHRVVDGAEAARFMETLQKEIAKP